MRYLFCNDAWKKSKDVRIGDQRFPRHFAVAQMNKQRWLLAEKAGSSCQLYPHEGDDRSLAHRPPEMWAQASCLALCMCLCPIGMEGMCCLTTQLLGSLQVVTEQRGDTSGSIWMFCSSRNGPEPRCCWSGMPVATEGLSSPGPNNN